MKGSNCVEISVFSFSGFTSALMNRSILVSLRTFLFIDCQNVKCYKIILITINRIQLHLFQLQLFLYLIPVVHSDPQIPSGLIAWAIYLFSCYPKLFPSLEYRYL